jgi:hypothetical protein
LELTVSQNNAIANRLVEEKVDHVGVGEVEIRHLLATQFRIAEDCR